MKLKLAIIFLWLAVIGLAVLIAGCDSPDSVRRDQCLRVVLFQQCLAASKSSSGDVVESCETAAGFQSLRPRMTIKPECMV